MHFQGDKGHGATSDVLVIPQGCLPQEEVAEAATPAVASVAEEAIANCSNDNMMIDFGVGYGMKIRVVYHFDTGSLAGIGIDIILVLVGRYFGWYFEH